MSTRKRNNLTNTNIAPWSDNPPASRNRKVTPKHKTTPPFYRMPFSNFIYILSALALVFFAIQAWRLIQLKSAAGGWWNLALGKRLSVSAKNDAHTYAGKANRKVDAEATGRESVEDRINALAEVLGLPSKDLASAIAEVFRNHLPPASLSSMTAAEATNSGTAASIFSGKQEVPKTVPGVADTMSAIFDGDDPVPLD